MKTLRAVLHRALDWLGSSPIQDEAERVERHRSINEAVRQYRVRALTPPAQSVRQ